MASLPVPSTTVDVLDRSGQFTLPWRRFFQSLAPTGTGGGGGTPGPQGPPGATGHTGATGPAGPSGATDFLQLSFLDGDSPSTDPLTLVGLAQQDHFLLAGSGISLTPNPAYGGPVTIAATGAGGTTNTFVSIFQGEDGEDGWMGPPGLQGPSGGGGGSVSITGDANYTTTSPNPITGTGSVLLTTLSESSVDSAQHRLCGGI